MSVRSGGGSCEGRGFAGGSTTDSAKPASGDEAGETVEGGGARLYAGLFSGNQRWGHCRIAMPTPVNDSIAGGFVRSRMSSKFGLTNEK